MSSGKLLAFVSRSRGVMVRISADPEVEIWVELAAENAAKFFLFAENLATSKNSEN